MLPTPPASEPMEQDETVRHKVEQDETVRHKVEQDETVRHKAEPSSGAEGFQLNLTQHLNPVGIISL